MQYIAHKDKERVQTLKEHLLGTAKLAGEFAAKFSKEEWGYCCGLLHDIGKYSKEFQKKIWGDTDDKVDHSTAGAKECFEKGGLYFLLSYCIAGHHAGLPDFGDRAIPSTLCNRLNKKIYDYQMYSSEITIPQLTTEPIEVSREKNMEFALSMFIRMLYSCLVDADFLDTESFMKNGDVKRDSGEGMERLLEKLETHMVSWLENTDGNTINGRRTEILKHCIERSKQEKGLFRLTVPTGGGKTTASLAFALNHAVKHDMDRIIYVIPYTSIIEQNAKVFRDILGTENVLEDHCNVVYKDSEEFKPMQLAAENWDKPVVVTTNVQFFESLFSNKSSKCRKLHNIANSVIIFDEAQMLPLDYLKPCMEALQELVETYRSSVVLCTATQPALDMFLHNSKQIKELCPDVEKQFAFFERVTYEKLGVITKSELVERLEGETRALCIVNTKKQAQDLYKELQGEGVYHLSTSMYPKHRKRVLDEIRTRLEKKEKCLVISTSLVEAGVDLDFSSVYRQIAGIDSMIQAAGRCNREGNEDKEDSKVYIFDLEDTKEAASQKLQIETAESVMQDYENLAGLECITEYFARLYHHRGSSLDKKNIMDEFRDKEYNFAKVGKEFKLIEQDTKTIVICKEKEAVELLDELKWKGLSKTGMREIQQYCIQVWDDSREESLFNKLYNAGMLESVSGELQDFYELVDLKKYSEEYGLDLFIDHGMAVFR